MISKIIQYIGIIIIVAFSSVSVFFSIAEREIDDQELRKKIGYTSFFEDRFYDFRMKRTLKTDVTDNRLVLAAIDDDSLLKEKIGRWPWTRTVWEKVLLKLKNYGAKVVSFDVFFSEPEVACNAESPDIAFANAIRDFQSIPGNKVILPYSLVEYKEDGFDMMPDALFNFILDTKQTEGKNLLESYVGKNVFPIQELVDTEAGIAHIEAKEDPDGIFRHYPLVSNVETLYFPSFGLMTYEAFTMDKSKLHIDEFGLAHLETTQGNITLNHKGETKIRWFGGPHNFPVVGIHKLLDAADDDPEMIKLLNGNIVFIGSTAFAAHDLRHTPIDHKLPGIYFHMNLVKMLLDGNYFVPEQSSTLYTWSLLLGGSLLMVLIMFFGNAILDLFTMLGLGIGMYIYDTYFLLPAGYQIKLFFVLFSIISCYSWTTFLHFYLSQKEKRKIKGTFASFVAPAVVEQMLANPDMVKVGGEKKNITVFFSDVRDFTSISEKLTPEELSICLNQYMGVMTDIIFETFGTLDKYIGDAIVAFWGAPIDVDNHAYHAVDAAIQMIEALPAVNERFEEQGFPLFKHGIGINTGDCSVGNMGSDKIFQYTALGDSMNLGARLESLCKFYGVQLNVSEFTLAAIPDELKQNLKYRTLDKVRVKGKEEAITMYEVFHPSHHLYTDQESAIAYEKAFECYQNMEFKEAIEILTPLTEKYPDDKSCARVKKSCEDYIETPPPADWDGVFTHTTKG